jgi:7-cyano-7-deazaguanine synthase in queuosine biosynthesis
MVRGEDYWIGCNNSHKMIDSINIDKVGTRLLIFVVNLISINNFLMIEIHVKLNTDRSKSYAFYNNFIYAPCGNCNYCKTSFNIE